MAAWVGQAKRATMNALNWLNGVDNCEERHIFGRFGQFKTTAASALGANNPRTDQRLEYFSKIPG